MVFVSNGAVFKVHFGEWILLVKPCAVAKLSNGENISCQDQTTYGTWMDTISSSYGALSSMVLWMDTVEP
jgi:hypothetical protein